MKKLLLFAMLLTLSVLALGSQAEKPGTGKRDIILGTRGFARVSADPHNSGIEAATLFRMALPYGASSGWRLVYQGYSDTTTDDIQIKGAAIWIQQPSEPRIRMRITFNHGKQAITIPHDMLVETDSLPDLRPGCIVWVTTWYRAGDSATGLPYQTFLNMRESAAGAEDRDGTFTQSYGAGVDKTINGGFSHVQLGGPLTAGLGYVARGYQPAAAVGKTSSSFSGVEAVPLFIGNSITVQLNDYTDSNNLFDFTGYQGWWSADRFPYLTFGQSGSASGGFLALQGTSLFNYFFGNGTAAYMRKGTHLFNAYGVNSLRVNNPSGGSAAGEWASRVAVGAIAQTCGLKYIQSCLTPVEQQWTFWSLDNATYANFVTQRGLFNDMVRTQSDDAHIPGCVGYWDPNSLLETALNSNIWVTGPAYKSDGIHPSTLGHCACASTIADALLIDNPNPVTQSSGPGQHKGKK